MSAVMERMDITRLQPEPAAGETRSTCCYCGTGCGVVIEHAGGVITGVRGDPEHTANFDRRCRK
jgi:assimilatory nitrate reductase catalytic subunit